MGTLNQYESSTVVLPAQQQLTVVAAAVSAGTIVQQSASAGGADQGVTPIAASETKTLGPYSSPQRFKINCTLGSLTHSMGQVDFPAPAEVLQAADGASEVIVITGVGTLTFVNGQLTVFEEE